MICEQAVVGFLAPVRLGGGRQNRCCRLTEEAHQSLDVRLRDCRSFGAICRNRAQSSAIRHRENALSDLFAAHLLTRNIKYEEDLVEQLFNSSEKSLARVLLMLAHFGKEGIPVSVIPKISPETLAEMAGTTRSQVSFFMNRFRKLGFID